MWDLAYVGSCFEQFYKLKGCYLVRDEHAELKWPLWISDGAVSVCTHGFIATPTAASMMQRALQQWLDAGWEHMRTEYRSALPCKKKKFWRGAARLSSTLSLDIPIREARLAGWLQALHAWPQLIEQRDRSRRRGFTYAYRKPPVCKEGPTLADAYYGLPKSKMLMESTNLTARAPTPV
jgi:hypothetical protein